MILVPYLGTFFLLLICLVQLQCNGFFFYLTIFYFVMLYCDLLQDSSFPIGNREWIWMGREVRGPVRSKGRGSVRKNEKAKLTRLYCMRKELFVVKVVEIKRKMVEFIW